jgi:opacity protein-like surface antigen
MIIKLGKYFLLFVLILQVNAFAGEPPASKAVGVFLAAGVGARLPIGDFSNSTDLGYGLNVEASYTDSDHLPFFVFARLGYEQFPGSQDFYQGTDYSNYSTSIIPVSLGVRYYFSPLVENVVLLMPIVEGSVSYTYFQVLNEFKADAGRSNYKEDLWKFGGTVGAGLSMFILEIMANYTYYESNQYLSFNLNIRLPIFVNL